MTVLPRIDQHSDFLTLLERCDAAARGRRGGTMFPEHAILTAASRAMHMPAHSIVFHEGDRANSVFTLVEGSAKLSRLRSDGREQIVGFRGPGSLIGYTVRDRYQFNFETVTDSLVRRHDRGRLEEACRRWASLSLHLLKLCADDLASSQDQLSAMSHRSAEGRVAAFILALRAVALRDGRAGLELHLPMMRSDVADYLGLSTESVSRVFSALRRAGVILEPDRRSLIIVSLVELELVSALDGASGSSSSLSTAADRRNTVAEAV